MSFSDGELLRQFAADRALAASVIFAHRHPNSSPPAHVEIMDLWACPEELVLIEAAREFGKSTLSEEFLLLEACFGNFNYCLLIGETYSKACQRLASIDYEARNNETLHGLFGGPVLARKGIENKAWFRTGAVIEAVGWEQELQSFKELTHRPDRAYLDDPENLERVRDASAVEASIRKFYLELLPALDKSHRRVRITQTRRAADCMVTRFAGSEGWLYRAFPVCDGDPEDPLTRSNWPDRYPMEWIRKEQAKYQAAGMLAEFKQAYLLQASDRAAKPFTDEQLASRDVAPWQWLPRYVIYDPSRSTRKERTRGDAASDRTGKVVVSRLGSQIIVHESGGFYWQPSQLVDDLFSAQEKHHPVKIGIERNSLDQWLSQPIRIEMMKRGESLPIALLSAPQDRSKEDFIMGLQPFAEAHDIVLVGGRSAHPQLVAEWCNFPAGPRDVMNALAYALKLFGGLPVYEDFSPANIDDAPRPDPGEVIHVAAHASSSELAACAVMRRERRLYVAGDWLLAGNISECVRSLMFSLRADFPGCRFRFWIPSELFDQADRLPLLGQLRAERAQVARSEAAMLSRGSLSERLRTVWKQQRLLIIDQKARNLVNALAAGYAYPAGKGGVSKAEPEPGNARLICEALEAMVAALDRQDRAQDLPDDAQLARNASGALYVTSNPRAQLRH